MVSELSPPSMTIPSPALPEITLVSPVAVPPIVLFGEDVIKIPCSPLPRAKVPLTSVPIKLPVTELLFVSESFIRIPCKSLPDITLPSPRVLSPPISLSDAPISMRIPLSPLPIIEVPV